MDIILLFLAKPLDKHGTTLVHITYPPLTIPQQIPLKLTKRMILSQIARIYDPVGFTAAFLVKAKIGLQQLWQKRLDWDQELPEEIYQDWVQLFEQM